MSSHSKTLTSGLVVMILVAASYLFAIRAKMHLFSFEPRYTNQLAISAAISRLKYGLPGYLGYNSVLENLNNALNDLSDNRNPVYDPCISNSGLRMCFFKFPSLNKVILQALKLQNVARDGAHTLRGQFSPGLVDYYSLSFLLFGYQFQSLLYFYFLLLAIQSLIFFVQFRDADHIITMQILFLIAHYMTLTALRFPGHQLDAPNNYRFLPVLAILPMLHICLLSLCQRKVNTPVVLGAIAQALLLAFIIQCRTSAYWVLVPVACVAVWPTYLQARRRKSQVLAINNAPPAPHWLLHSFATSWWPVLLAFGMVFSMVSFYRSQQAAVYFEDPNAAAHPFWHNVFIGLALHPDIRLEYTGFVASEFYFTWTPGGLVSVDNRTKDRSITEYIKQAFSWVTIQNHANDMFSHVAVAKRYAILGKDPKSVFGASARIEKNGVAFDWGEVKQSDHELDIVFGWDEVQTSIYEREVGKLVWEVVLKYPGVVLEQVFIAKPILFSWYYLTCYIPFKYECAFWGGRNNHLTEPLALLVIFTGLAYAVILAWKNPGASVHGALGLLLLCFGCSLIPSLLVYPEPWTIGDAVVALTLCQLFLVFLFFRIILNKAIATKVAD